MADPLTLRYELPAPGVARIVLDRPEARNAQDKRMTYELNAAFDRAAQDDEVRVVVLAGDGPHFCAGHDLRDRVRMDEFETVSTWSGFRRPGAEGLMAAEEELYLQMCWRWRNLPKPTIASVHGKTIAGGLMLVWVCDLVIAADDARFSDPTVAMGVNGIELFAHPWELGARKAKELLFTGDEFGAEEAHRLGMVNQVVPRAELESRTLDLAARIATKPSFALKLAKQSVNQALDAQGQWTSHQAAFSLHQLAHSHNGQVFGMPVDPSGVPAGMAARRPAPEPDGAGSTATPPVS